MDVTVLQECQLVDGRFSVFDVLQTLVDLSTSKGISFTAEPIAERGTPGEVVKVKRGYARNFLIPKKLAAYGTDANILKYSALFKPAAEVASENRVAEFASEVVRFVRAATSSGGLFGSVSVADIKTYFEEKQVAVKEVVIENEVIKTLGKFKVKVDGVYLNVEVVNE